MIDIDAQMMVTMVYPAALASAAPGTPACELQREATLAAGEVRHALARGYILVALPGQAPATYDLGPDDRKVLEAHAVDYDAKAGAFGTECRPGR